jgi:hypothetical protein
MILRLRAAFQQSNHATRGPRTMRPPPAPAVPLLEQAVLGQLIKQCEGGTRSSDAMLALTGRSERRRPSRGMLQLACDSGARGQIAVNCR